ncbi:MAG: hypothetical protein COV48_08615 [Elusimicrobia bacterium CG11_big_fil_rev_8_21_14_0_20_64_6]|nr:MAG: hypothetical protein COV48_08615 [Elusimicrobia bacterium CG11_big_fil_rev_8_21_14_0_20_64_6]
MNLLMSKVGGEHSCVELARVILECFHSKNWPPVRINYCGEIPDVVVTLELEWFTGLREKARLAVARRPNDLFPAILRWAISDPPAYIGRDNPVISPGFGNRFVEQGVRLSLRLVADARCFRIIAALVIKKLFSFLRSASVGIRISLSFVLTPILRSSSSLRSLARLAGPELTAAFARSIRYLISACCGTEAARNWADAEVARRMTVSGIVIALAALLNRRL